MNNQEQVLNLVYDIPGNIADVKKISEWTGLNARAVYRAAEHLQNRGAIQKEKVISIEKGNPPIVKLKIKITPKKMSKALWILGYKN